jgi:hypothetical protein
VKYMLFFCVDHKVKLKPEHGAALPTASQAWVAEMHARDVRSEGWELHPVETATTVRVRDGEVLLTDGPFAEADEQIAGVDILECADLDEALEAAWRHPVAAFGAVEIRPFADS